MNLPAEALKLVSAVIVAIAISFPYLKEKAGFYKHRRDVMRQASKNA